MAQRADDRQGNLIGPHHGPLKQREEVRQQPIVDFREADLAQGFRQILPIGVVPRIEPGGVSQGRDGLADSAGLMIGESKIVISLGVIGPVGDRLLEAGDGLLRQPLAVQDITEIEIRLAVIGTQGDRLAVAGGAIVQASQHAQGHAQVDVIGGDGGIEVDGAGNQAQGVLPAPALEGDHAQQVIGVGMVGLARQDALV